MAGVMLRRRRGPPVFSAPPAPRPGSGERGPSEVPGGGGAGAGRGDAGEAPAAPPRERAVPRARRVMLGRDRARRSDKEERATYFVENVPGEREAL
ncbi:CDC42 small effector protein 2 isoform 1-T2 [Geothlypis trichas]